MHVRRERRLGHGLQPDVVRHVGEVGLTGRHTANQLQRLGHIEVRVVRSEAQGIDHKHLDAGEFLHLTLLDGLEVGQVGQRTDAVARHGKTLGVAARHRDDLHPFTEKGHAGSISCSSISGTPRYLSCAKA